MRDENHDWTSSGDELYGVAERCISTEQRIKRQGRVRLDRSCSMNATRYGTRYFAGKSTGKADEVTNALFDGLTAAELKKYG